MLDKQNGLLLFGDNAILDVLIQDKGMEKDFSLSVDNMSIKFSASFDLHTNIFAGLSRDHEKQNEQSKPMLTSHIFS